ncbi:MAG: tryptophan 2,3-dioxygenase family protein [Chloroflexi bacterium]|nr:tryptophan 2,3-dioxygenase family protein [Chloroflexota bacterium]
MDDGRPDAAGPRDDHPTAGAVLDFEGRLSYGDYLHLDELLAAQQPRTDAHDELLFIIEHQQTELWFKLILHELREVIRLIVDGQLRASFKGLARIERVMLVLNDAWDVLTTLTPADYSAFRDALLQSSGFQSHQYREFEFLLGNKDPMYVRPFSHRPEIHAPLLDALASPSLYDRTVQLLGTRGFAIDPAVLDRDWAEPYTSNESVLEAWRAVYSDSTHHWDLYELGEELVDLEEATRRWRFRHVTTVERIIGGKPGTGGTPGVPYLRERLSIVLFPELWQVRTQL